MADESFHLTPLDVRRFDFGSAMRGYDRVRVDQFRDQVAAELERLIKQQQSLEAKAQGFHEQLRAFRERDKALSEALVSAQRLGNEVKEQAQREAHLLVREAKADGEEIVASARASVAKIAKEIDVLVKQRRAFLVQLRAIIERHLAEIEVAEASPPPGRSTDQTPDRATSTAGGD